MDRAQLLEHFGTLAETTDAIEKLRKLVLDLAIRGRLVAQNPKDGSALRLVETAKTLSEKNQKKSCEQDDVEQEILPFTLPQNWCWTRLEELGDTAPHNALDDKTEVGFSPMRLVTAKFGEPISFERRTWSEVRKGFTHFADGDVVVAKITPCFENGKSGVIRGAPNGFGAGTTELHVFRPVANCVLPEYALTFLKSPHFLLNGRKHMTGSAGQKRVPWNYFAKTPFPLPSLAEQRRIVAKVEELLALCDELEARQATAREHRTRLVRSALDHISVRTVPGDFRRHAIFFVKQFRLFTATVDLIPLLRAGMIEMGVTGALTGGASEWEELQLRKVAESRLGKMLDKAKNKGRPLPYLRNTNVQWFRFELTDVKEMLFEEDELDEFSLRKGDLLICEGGEPGRCAVWEGRLPNMVFQKAIHRVRTNSKLLPQFLAYRLRADATSGRLEKHFTGATIKHFTGQELARYTFPLPSIAEQQRIVAKVDELMRWCDALEARLTAAQTTATHLLDATLRRILDRAVEGEL